MARFAILKTMSSKELQTNIKGLNVVVAKSGASVLIICVLVTVIFRSVLSLGLNIERYVLWGLWVLLPGMWVIGSMIARDKWRKSSYKLTDDALVISQGNMMGGANRQMYRYDAIIAVNIKQDVWGSRFDYGDIYIKIPRLGRDVVLRAVANPNEQIKPLKALVNQHSNTRPSPGI